MRDHIWINFDQSWSIRSTQLGGFITYYDEEAKLWRLDLHNRVDDGFYIIWQGKDEKIGNQIRYELVKEINRLEMEMPGTIFDMDEWILSLLKSDSKTLSLAYI